MELRTIKSKLKKCQPYFIERDLLSKLYFREGTKEQEKWIFTYTFIRRLSDVAISIRLGYTSQNIHYITKKILESNKQIIEDFILTQNI